MNKHKLLTVLLLGLLTLSLAACNASGKEGGTFASVPAGDGYAEGKGIFFTHTEASDPAIAEKLTKMMKSPVLLVPALADTPDSLLATVYVFENGLKGKGPLGFQADVFDNPPQMADKYTPLRRLVTVKWNDGVTARLLKSAAEVSAAETAGELVLTPTKVVINMPFLTWDGGQR